MTTSTELVSVEAKINLDDVVSVRVAEVELQLDQRINDQRKLVIAKREELDKIKLKLAEAAEADAAAHVKAHATAIDGALKAAGVNLSVAYAKNTASADGANGKLHFSINLETHDGKNSHRYCSAPVTIPLSKKVKEALKDVEDARQAFSDVNDGLVVLVDGKARVPTFERNCRAKVAENRLSKTAEGREILAKLRSENVNNILSLPTGTL